MSLRITANLAPLPLHLKRSLRNASLLAACVLLAGCETLGTVTGTGGGPRQGQVGFVRGFLGGVATDEPRAAIVAREVLSAGGNAVDAAVAAGFALSVTLPSRAALGGGGACLAWNAARREVLGFDFAARAPSATSPADDRPAAVPMLARGLFALHARGGGQLPFERAVAPAEAVARFGTGASRALVRDLSPVAAALVRDPAAAAVFAPGGRTLAEGDQLVQPELANTLGLIRTQGPGDFHQGQLARRIEEASPAAGGSLTVADLRAAVPRVAPVAGQRAGTDLAFAAPDPAAQAAMEAFLANQPAAADRFPPAGAGTAFVTFDRDGSAVACVLTMNNLFGTGRMVPGTGMLLAAAPGARVPPAPLPVLIVANDRIGRLRFAGAASGGAAGPAALATVANLAMREQAPARDALARPRNATQGEGQVTVLHCPRLFIAEPGECTLAIDPRGAGLALGGE
jgi:gamma-glutamyltranspeptidase/glutathione hydrolase